MQLLLDKLGSWQVRKTLPIYFVRTQVWKETSLKTSLKRNTISTQNFMIFSGQNPKHSIFQDIFQDEKNFRAFPGLLEFPGLVDTLLNKVWKICGFLFYQNVTV